MTTATLLFALLVAVPASPDSGGERQPIMLDFTASWCGPCRQMRPTVDQLIDKGFPIKAIDIDQSPELAAKYKVSGIPAFIVIDPTTGKSLGRLEGARPASDLAGLYNEAKSKYLAQNPSRPRREVVQNSEQASEDREGNDDREHDLAPNPKPWETVVRIKVHGNGAIGFGSGTIVSSTPEETIILTCAHIFKIDGRKQVKPASFPLRITVDLFDGNPVGPKRNQVHYTNETFEGRAIDYNFITDVGLIRIRPGKRLAYAKVIPPSRKPKPNLPVITVGCSQGQDATAWSTKITNPSFKGLANNGNYEAIECNVAPIQGRSGGGLFTTDGYVIGVCDFAEPQGNHGLYAHPNSIYAILNRNNLVALYDPSRAQPDTRLAANPETNIGRAAIEVRGQSPDANDPDRVTLPAPEFVGVKPPILVKGEEHSVRPKRMSWHPSDTKPVAIHLDQSADTDKFDNGRPRPEIDTEPTRPVRVEKSSPTTASKISGGKWKKSVTPLPALTSPGSN